MRRTFPFSRSGQEVEATVEAYPNRTFTGKLALIYPQLDTATRTNRIRFELDNPRHELRPGMFATVRINTPLESIEPYKSAAQVSPLPPGEGQGEGSIESGMATASDGPHPNPLPKGEGTDSPRLITSSSSCRSGPSSIPARRRWCTSSGNRGCSKGWKSSLGLARTNTIRSSRDSKAGDKVAAAGGFLIDAETRLNPAAASTYFGASGGPQSSAVRHAATAPAASSPHRQASRIGEPVKPAARRCRKSPTEDLKNIEQLPEADRKLALAQRHLPRHRRAVGLDGRSGEDHPSRPDGLSLLQGVRRQGKRRPRRNAAKSGRTAERRSRP